MHHLIPQRSETSQGNLRSTDRDDRGPLNATHTRLRAGKMHARPVMMTTAVIIFFLSGPSSGYYTAQSVWHTDIWFEGVEPPNRAVTLLFFTAVKKNLACWLIFRLSSDQNLCNPLKKSPWEPCTVWFVAQVILTESNTTLSLVICFALAFQPHRASRVNRSGCLSQVRLMRVCNDKHMNYSSTLMHVCRLEKNNYCSTVLFLSSLFMSLFQTA